ncbi:MAG TPA: hypothetical protein DCR35_09545 [Runella sp.]|nr:hypothetical protein [Runella sp.]
MRLPERKAAKPCWPNHQLTAKIGDVKAKTYIKKAVETLNYYKKIPHSPWRTGEGMVGPKSKVG